MKSGLKGSSPHCLNLYRDEKRELIPTHLITYLGSQPMMSGHSTVWVSLNLYRDEKRTENASADSGVCLNLYRDEKLKVSIPRSVNSQSKFKLVSTYTAMKSGLKVNGSKGGSGVPSKVSTYTAMKSGLKGATNRPL